MRHKVAGRTLNRNASHRKAMFKNMAASLIKTLRDVEGAENNAKVHGRITTTIPKAKELRPFIEKLITLAKKGIIHDQNAAQFATNAERNSAEWKAWRESDRYQKWLNASSPAIEARRRAFAALRDKAAVKILFEELAPKFASREGGYTRIMKLAKFRIGDATRHAFIEFVGENDRVKRERRSRKVEPLAVTKSEASEPAAPATEAGASV
ncbi:MAG: ribosomal protein [Planctomycetaceae bacterium]|nr:ribosomal protein [Planctomycetaceae bacterium]